jgi:hypothetical protein
VVLESPAAVDEAPTFEQLVARVLEVLRSMNRLIRIVEFRSDGGSALGGHSKRVWSGHPGDRYFNLEKKRFCCRFAAEAATRDGIAPATYNE